MGSYLDNFGSAIICLDKHSLFKLKYYYAKLVGQLPNGFIFFRSSYRWNKANESLVDKLLSNVAQERKYSKRHEEELKFELEQEREKNRILEKKLNNRERGDCN